MQDDSEVLIAVDVGTEIQQVVEKLRAQGIEVETVLEQIRTIAARVPASRIAEISKLPGVAAVETSREIRIAPPESELQ